ncbi:MAG: hypothetical protein ACRENO_02155 [Thermodesulfobacteriota bacterium]
MLNRIRKDIKNNFSKTDIMLVNTAIFSYCNICEYDPRSLLSELRKVNIVIFFYDGNSNCLFIKHNIELIQQNGHKIFTTDSLFQSQIDGSNFLITACDISDIPLVQKSLFSISSFSSPLELRMISSYVSNFDGEKLFKEVGNLLVKSRS